MRCECKSLMASTVTVSETARAQADVFLCTNKECAKVKFKAVLSKGRKPDERLRGRIVTRAQRYAQDLKAGDMVWNGRLFIWPASKGGPGK